MRNSPNGNCTETLWLHHSSLTGPSESLQVSLRVTSMQYFPESGNHVGNSFTDLNKILKNALYGYQSADVIISLILHPTVLLRDLWRHSKFCEGCIKKNEEHTTLKEFIDKAKFKLVFIVFIFFASSYV